MRRLVTVAVLVLTGTLLTSCAQDPMIDGDVCPAIGWDNAIQVDASDFGDDVFVQLCTDAGCSPAPGVTRTVDEDLAVPRGGNGVFQIGFAAPEVVTIRVYDAAGALLHDAEHNVDWTHTEGRCGGPSTAEPVVLTP